MKYVFNIATLATLFLTCRCSFPSPLGEDIVKSEVLDIVYIDTIGIKLSTVLLDSIITLNSPSHLIGYHKDENFGEVISSAFSSFSLDSMRFPDDEAQYLYAELVLQHDGYYHYDTTDLFTVNVYPLTEEIELNDEGYLTNLSEFDYNKNLLIGSSSSMPRPFTNRDILVPINSEYGSFIFRAAVDQDRNDFFNDFNETFPGLVIQSDTTRSGAFYGFTIFSKLVIHYAEFGEEKEIVLPLSSRRYNQILNDRSDSELASLNSRKEDVVSSKTSNKVFMHNGIGMAIKVEVPFLRDIRSVLETNFITEANLILKPVKNSYSKFSPLPNVLEFFEVDKLNRSERSLSLPGRLTIDDEFEEATEYRFQVTDFIQEKIDEATLDEHSILILGANNTRGISVDQLVIGDTFSEYEARLELFILDYIIDN